MKQDYGGVEKRMRKRGRAARRDKSARKKTTQKQRAGKKATSRFKLSLWESKQSRGGFFPDTLLSFITKYEPITLNDLAASLRLSKDELEPWLDIFAQASLIQVQYPLNIFASPRITRTRITADKQPRPPPASLPASPILGKIRERYKINADGVQAQVQIFESDNETVPIYSITLSPISPAGEALLEAVFTELSQKTNLDAEVMQDADKFEKKKQEFISLAKQAITKKIPHISESLLNQFSGMLVQRAYGLGVIDLFLADDFIEEFAINGAKQPIALYHKKHGWIKTTHHLQSEEEVYTIAARIARKVNRDINVLHPLMDAHLLSGDRVAATLFPISTQGNTITIRRFARNPWTLPQFLQKDTNTLSIEIAAFLWQAIQYELNILIAGGTASGKTSLLNSLCAAIPPTQRIISIEDTREFFLPKSLTWNWVPLTSRNPNIEGQGGVTMLDLIIASLRMRPDRIVVGEIRKREQAEALFEAMHTGHSVYATMHADTAQQVKRRLIEPPIAIPQAELKALQLILVQYRDRRSGRRRVIELVEVLSESDEVELNYLYRWIPRTDTFEQVNKSVRVVEELNLHTGMSSQEIEDDRKEKERILHWMAQNKITDIQSVGSIIQLYYKDKKALFKKMKHDKT